MNKCGCKVTHGVNHEHEIEFCPQHDDDVEELQARIAELEKAREIGTLMANLCYNGMQSDTIPEEYRKSMAELVKAWDKAREARLSLSKH